MCEEMKINFYEMKLLMGFLQHCCKMVKKKKRRETLAAMGPSTEEGTEHKGYVKTAWVFPSLLCNMFVTANNLNLPTTLHLDYVNSLCSVRALVT